LNCALSPVIIIILKIFQVFGNYLDAITVIYIF
jgi:hypothetical protein